MADDVGERDAVQVVKYDFIKALVDRQGDTVIRICASVWDVIHAADRGEAALRAFQDFPDGDLIRASCQLITAHMTFVGQEQIAAVEKRDDLFQVFFGNILSGGYIFERDKSLVVVLR